LIQISSLSAALSSPRYPPWMAVDAIGSVSREALVSRFDTTGESASGQNRKAVQPLPNSSASAPPRLWQSVTRRFPRSVIAIEALSPMVFIHTRWIIMVPGHQQLLGFLAPLFESHRRLVSHSVSRPAETLAGRRASDHVPVRRQDRGHKDRTP